jgi:hypothetical protein
MENFVDHKIVNGWGREKRVHLHIMSAMAAWEFRNKFRWFLAATDPKKKRAFIDIAFKMIEVETVAGNFVPLITDAMVSNHIGSGDEGQEIMRDLFDSLLAANRIDKKWCAEQLTYTKNVSDKAANVFLSFCVPRLLSGGLLMVGK